MKLHDVESAWKLWRNYESAFDFHEVSARSQQLKCPIMGRSLIRH